MMFHTVDLYDFVGLHDKNSNGQGIIWGFQPISIPFPKLTDTLTPSTGSLVQDQWGFFPLRTLSSLFNELVPFFPTTPIYKSSHLKIWDQKWPYFSWCIFDSHIWCQNLTLKW